MFFLKSPSTDSGTPVLALILGSVLVTEACCSVAVLATLISCVSSGGVSIFLSLSHVKSLLTVFASVF